MKEQGNVSADPLCCMRCGGPMVHRKPKPGGKRFSPFYGCSTYPRCKRTCTEREAGAIVHGDHPEEVDW
jgi:ssDNA-binding Zn-finger/Zn-ribbon topoisomerase 1